MCILVYSRLRILSFIRTWRYKPSWLTLIIMTLYTTWWQVWKLEVKTRTKYTCDGPALEIQVQEVILKVMNIWKC